jgi:hypothetical protein
MFPSACAVVTRWPIGTALPVILREAIHSPCFVCQIKAGTITDQINLTAPMVVLCGPHTWLGLVEQINPDEALIHSRHGTRYFRLSEACLIALN